MHLPDLIPPEKSAAVTRALLKAFSTTDIEDIRRMTRGLSSDLVFRIVVRGTPCLLRVMMRINEQNDPARHFGSMKAAAEAGIAPRVRYASIEDGIAITDFIEAVPFPAAEALLQVPPVLRKLHALPRFPKTFNYGTMYNGFFRRFQTAHLLPQNEVDEVFARYAQLSAVYPRLESDMVSSHSDLKPENILFDGRRVWLVDWQAAFVNDRYFDLSVVANFVIRSHADEAALLHAYFGQPADKYQRARLFLMHQLIHMMYAVVFLMLGAGGKPVNPSGVLPSFRDFHDRIWAGEISLADNETKVIYGIVHWKQLLENLRRTRFDESLRIVSERHPSPETTLRLLPN